MLFRNFRLQRLENLPYQLRQIEVLPPELIASRLQPAEGQKLQHHPVHFIRFLPDYAEIMVLLALVNMLLQGLGIRRHHRNGSFELMGNGRGHGAAGFLRVFRIGDGLLLAGQLIL